MRVVTHSSGNHGRALAWAATLRGISAHVVTPASAPQFKLASVRRYGAKITLCEPSIEAREATAARIQSETGATLIHPYNDLRVMAGQGTTAIELLKDLPDLEMILCPVGGGGQFSGIAVAANSLKPSIRLIGLEPAGADDAGRSFRAGRIIPLVKHHTIADGLVTSLGELTFAEIRRWVDDIVTVSKGAIVKAMRTPWEVLKLVVEPSGAVAYAAIRSRKLQVAGTRIALILSGRNLDLDRLPWTHDRI